MPEPRRPRPPRSTSTRGAAGAPDPRPAGLRAARADGPRAARAPDRRRPAERPGPATGRAAPRGPGVPRGPLVAIAVLGLLLVLVVASLVVRAGHDGEALPGTRVAGVDVGGLPASRIASRLRPVVGDQRTLRLRADGDVVTIRASDLGYAVDLDGTARAAIAAGRGGALNALVGPLRGYVAPRDVPVRSSFDEAAARKALAPVARKVARGAYAGALKVDPETLEVSTTKPRAGRAVDLQALVARVRRELREGDGATFDVPLRSVDAVPESRLQEVATEAEDYLRQPLRLTGAGSPLTLSTAQTASILALESRDGGRRAELGAGGEALTALLDRIEKRGRKLPRDATVTAPRTAASLTDKGDVTWRPRSASVTVKAGRTGREVRRDRLASRIEAAVAAGRHAVSVPRRTVQPDVTSATARRIDAVIGTFTTPYVAGQPRVTNIRQMARTVDGTLIAPGEQFSLNGITGERTKAKGYVEAPFIANNRIEPSVGGGVSQFSTTMYNAAYFAGLQLDAHRAHSLYIDRYPPGRESTLNFPDIDLRWTNDTEAPVLVRTSYDDAGVTVTLYGDNGGRRVTAKAGDRQAADGGDFQITVTRTVRYADGRTVTQPSTTRYEKEQQGETE